MRRPAARRKIMRDVPDILLADARNYLDITWADADGDVKLLGILARGMGYLDHAAGVELDYGEGTAARALLLDYVRYVRAGALQDFGRDFASELLGLHIAGEVVQFDGIQRWDDRCLCGGEPGCARGKAERCVIQTGHFTLSEAYSGHPEALCRHECRRQGGPAAAGPLPAVGVHPGCGGAYAGREAVPNHPDPGPGGRGPTGDGPDAGTIGEGL